MNVIVDFKLVTLLSPFVSWFIYDLIHSSVVFEKYKNWLYKEDDNGFDVPKHKYPLGYCLKCMGVWVSIFIYLNPYFEFTLFITLISISYFIIVKVFYK